MAQKRPASARRKCFISYHDANRRAVENFVAMFRDVIIARTIGITDADPWVDSRDADYIKRVIREKHLTDSTVTIVLIGRCTWARRFVDWEIASSLRNDPNNKRSGILGIKLQSGVTIPARLRDNLPSNNGPGYARIRSYPTTSDALRRWVEDAFTARTTRQSYINNRRSLRKRNGTCRK